MIKIIAVIACIIQILLVIAAYFSKGFWGWQINLTTFMLLSIIPLTCLFALVRHYKSSQFSARPLSAKAKNRLVNHLLYNGNNKRLSTRIEYDKGHKPVIKIANRDFFVYDISEHGLRIFGNAILGVDHIIKGSLTLLHGETVSINGNIKWHHDSEFGLSLTSAISKEVLGRELAYIQNR